MSAGRCILSVNAGSSSLKLALFDADSPGRIAGETFGGLDADERRRDDVLRGIGEWTERHAGGRGIVAAGHRVVHGGTAYSAPVAVDDAVLAELEALVPLAPLHQPHSIAPIRALRASHPSLPQVACFDTAFHRGRPSSVERYALPRALFDAGIRRYGFHGLSYEFVSGRLREVAPELAGGRVVIAHLGAGASLCAIRDGRCVDTTMGFSTLDGLVMNTRCGSLDPGVVVHLLRDGTRSLADVEDILYRDSGLLGVSGLSADMRELLASDLPAAREAVDCFVLGVARCLGSLVAVLGGLDALVFTAGIGEHSAEIRARVCRASAWTGLLPDDASNAAGGPCISASGSRVSAWVIPTDEEAMIAAHVRRLVRR